MSHNPKTIIDLSGLALIPRWARALKLTDEPTDDDPEVTPEVYAIEARQTLRDLAEILAGVIRLPRGTTIKIEHDGKPVAEWAVSGAGAPSFTPKRYSIN